ncbi:MAG: ThuA domain-containing protein [Thermoguttaceae bacterium]|nr:ThuA domain-containing protein [Thermoguttaceae bacterium]
MRRRDFLTASASIAAALPFVSTLSPLFGAEGEAKKILFFSRSQGFEHSPIKFDENGDCLAAKKLTELAKPLGFEVVSTKDGKVFDGDLSQYAAFVFYTSGQLDQEGGDNQNPMTEQGLKNLFDAIRGGTGFLGFHSSTDTFNRHTGFFCDPYYEQHEYIRVTGGEFIIHGEQQEATVEICDETLPSLAKRKPGFRLHEEWYANKNFAPDLRVLASLQTADMKKDGRNKCYDRPAFPCVWARKEKKGTVLYCAFGHKDEYWTNGELDDVNSDLLKAVVGQIEVPTLPNLKTVCPGADMLQNDWVKGLVNESD